MQQIIQNRIGIVFIPVSDIRRSIEWYSRLFQLPISETSHENRIYELSMQGDVSLLLDAHRPVVNSSQPLCLLWTDDIQQALVWMRQLNVDVLGEIADIGSLFTLTFRDPDGNLLMLGQRVRSANTESA